LTLARTIKLRADLNCQLAEAKFRSSEMEQKRDQTLEELNQKKKFFQEIEAKTEEAKNERIEK
jgi:hypothetical protein